MIDTRKVESFLRAAENLSLTESAKQMHLSQPALSYQIKLLEEELGVKLFVRSNIGLKLTDEGRTFLPWAQRLVQDENQMKEMMFSLDSEIAGSLCVACSSTSGRYVLPVMVARFCKSYPGIQARILSCAPKYIALHLLEGEAHLGIISSEVNNGNLESQEFFHDPINLIVPSDHPFAARTYVDPAEILKEDFIMRESSSGTRQIMLEKLAQFDINIDDLNVFLEVGNVEAVLELVAGGYGIAFVSDLASRRMRELKRVVKIKVAGVNMRRTNFMVRKHTSSPHRPRDAFWGFIHAPENADLLQSDIA